MKRLAQRMRAESDIQEKTRLAIVILKTCYPHTHKDGGPGSGNWGHKGRPGEVGGSSAGGGKENRASLKNGGYTSVAKVQAKLAKPHETSVKELKSLPEYSAIYTQDGNRWMFNYKYDGTLTLCCYDGEEYDYFNFGADTAETGLKSLIVYNSPVTISAPDLSVVDAVKLDDPDYVEEILETGSSSDEVQQKFSNAYRAEDAQDYDDKYRDTTSEIWNDISYDEQRALYRYTSGEYTEINGKLRTADASNDDYNSQIVNEEIKYMTDAIDRSELQEDTILYRGISVSACEKLFGMEEGSLSPATINDLVGKDGTDDGFSSSGSINGYGFDGRDVVLEIYAPKGTKAIYAEPFSACGFGDGISWDGVSKQETFSSEDETIIQRGTSYSIISANYGQSRIGKMQYRIQVAITGQDYNDSDYSKKMEQES